MVDASGCFMTVITQRACCTIIMGAVVGLKAELSRQSEDQPFGHYGFTGITVHSTHVLAIL